MKIKSIVSSIIAGIAASVSFGQAEADPATVEKAAQYWNSMERILYAELPADTSVAIGCHQLDSAIFYFYNYIKIAKNTLPPAAFKTKTVYYLLALQTRFRYIYLRNPDKNSCYKSKNYTILDLALKIDPNNMMVLNNKLLFESEIERLEHNKTKIALKTFEQENAKQQSLLDAKIRLLSSQENQILTQKRNLTEQSSKLRAQNEEIALGEQKIQAQKDTLNEQLSRIETQKLLMLLFVIVLILVLSLAFFIYRNYRQNKKINLELDLRNKKIENAYQIIEQKNHEITDSINYAQRIQGAMLPPLTEIRRALPGSFVLLKPKDIVSGDFYWFDQKDGKYFIAAADCTGHGVPGAIMSMLGAERLHEALSQSTDVSKMLSLLNRGVKKALRQSGNVDATRDGMDIALCSFSNDLKTFEYAGANRPVWVLRKGAAEIEETKATKTAIAGLTSDDQEFIKHVFHLQEGDTVYIFSDGYADQFSPQDKKLMTRKFRSLILSIQDKAMPQQQEYLASFIDEWKGDMEQTDDILVIGIRV
jgi:serine phosphatase RsbU (regulator of sigma subunit)